MPELRPERMAEFDRMRRRLAYALLALVALIVVGTSGFAWIGGEEHGIVDAFYMTVITLTTVGYGEIISLDGNPTGRIFTVVLLLGGMGIVAYAVPLLAAFLIEGHFLNLFTRRRMHKTIEAMSGHYIVCGCNPAARHVAEELIRTGRDVVLVASTGEGLEELGSHFDNLPGIVGDPSDDEVLVAAGIERAAGIVASLTSDKDNVIVSLTARRLAPRVRIIASTERPENAPKMRVAGADSVVSPCRIGGLRMASELVRPTVVTFLDKMLRDQEASLRVEEVRVPEDAPVVGRTLGSVEVSKVSGALLVAVVPSGGKKFEFNPPPDRTVEAGMTFVIMANAASRERLQKHLGG